MTILPAAVEEEEEIPVTESESEDPAASKLPTACSASASVAAPVAPEALFTSVRPETVRPSSRKGKNVRPYRKAYLTRLLSLMTAQWIAFIDALTTIYQDNLDIIKIPCNMHSHDFCRRLTEAGLPEPVVASLPELKMPFMLYQAALVAKQTFNAKSNKMKLVGP